MAFKTITKADGGEVIADEMSPRLRAFAFLLEHANRRQAAGIEPPACHCPECKGPRATLEALRSAPLRVTRQPVTAEQLAAILARPKDAA